MTEAAGAQLFRALLEAAPDAMVVVDSRGRIVLVNAQTEKLFGHRREQLIGQMVEILMPGRARAQHAGQRTGYSAAPRVRGMGTGLELFAVRSDGTQFPVDISLSPLETDEGVLIVSAIRDVTARKRIESALIAANRELESFSYSVAHDLRAPLVRMSGFARILIDEHREKLDQDGRELLREIDGNARQMSALIDAMMSLARVTRIELKPERVDLTALAHAVAAQLAAADAGRTVELHALDGLEAHMDPTLARNLIENLLGNSWKFTRGAAAPKVELGRTERDGHPAFFVRDNGAGFDMSYAEKLFRPFQRLHSASEFPGTGIGLATAQRIVHRHGGRIWAEGTVGEGATFYFTVATGAVG
jgi:PAS domain S-box-containing protein